MNTYRRDFLRKIASAVALGASVSVLEQDAGEAATIHTPHLTGIYRDPKLGGLRDQFPVLKERVNGRPLVYLESAATTQRPRAVIDALTNFYMHDNANPAKTLHTLARRSAAQYEKARETVARFVHALRPDEIVWTRGTTISVLLTGRSLEPGNSLEPTPKTRLAAGPLFCWRARFGRANRNLSTCAPESN
jgi:selenocysteine lyase/cysteine desulfurase